MHDHGRERSWLHDRDFGFGDFEVVSRPARRRPHPAPAAARRPSAPAPVGTRHLAAPAPARRISGPAPTPAPAPADYAPARPEAAPGGRRTITIQGRGSDRTWSPTGPPPARRPQRDSYSRIATKPDRVALWAVLLGIVLVLAAATSSHAAVLHAQHAARLLLGH